MKQTKLSNSLICLVATIVLAGCASSQYSRSTGRYIDDVATTARVKTALAGDSITKATQINVDTFRGNVHLNGFVDTQMEKERASQVTRNVKGVEWFKNDLVVKGELPVAASKPSEQISEPSGAGRETDKSKQQK
jgi:hypothetical protein